MLPSFNLRAHPTEELQARFAYSQSIARPSGSSGNPFLRRIELDNFDATPEW